LAFGRFDQTRVGGAFLGIGHGVGGRFCLAARRALARFAGLTDLGLVTGAVGGLFLLAQAFIAFAVAFGLTVAILLLLLFAGLFDLAHRFGEHPGIMFGVLRKVFSSDAVARQLGIAVQLIILFDDLLRRAAHLAIGARAVENPVDDIAARGSIVVAVLIAPRP